MHTDDVFIGILVNKTSFINATALLCLSAGFDNRLTSNLLDGRPKFYHLPDLKLYYMLASADLAAYEAGINRYTAIAGLEDSATIPCISDSLQLSSNENKEMSYTLADSPAKKFPRIFRSRLINDKITN